MKIVCWFNIITYTMAKIELRPGNQINEITMINSQIPSNEFISNELELDQLLLSPESNSNIPGTLKPETVLSRPYKDPKDIRYIQNSNPIKNIVAYDSNNHSFYLEKEYAVHVNQPDQKGLESPGLIFDSPTMTSTNDIKNEENTILSPLRKRNFVLVQSNNGKIYSLYKNQPKQDEHQAQRPPTWKTFPGSGNRVLNISSQSRHSAPDPTFQSASPLNLQIEKVDGTYLNASDSTFHQRKKENNNFL